MRITAAIANYNYGEYLDQCIRSALEFCDEVLVYDDASTDDSWDIISKHPVKAFRSDANHGGPVWAYDRAIGEASGEYLVLLDSDNYLLNRPTLFGDYRFGSIRLIDGRGKPLRAWDYSMWPTDPDGCLDIYRRDMSQPLPSGGYWRLDFIRENGLHLERFGESDWAYDIATHVEWLKYNPVISILPQPNLMFRWHDGQITQRCDLREAAYGEMLKARGEL